MKHTSSQRVAFCGVLSALMLVLMLVGPLIPATSYICPGLAGALLVPLLWEFGRKAGLTAYLAVSLLSLFLCPDKEAAVFFVLLLGWYPLLRPRLAHLQKKPLRVLVKVVLFNLSTVLSYLLLLFVLMPEAQEDFLRDGWPLLALTLLMGNISFLLYDFALARWTDYYVCQLRPKLFPHHH